MRMKLSTSKILLEYHLGPSYDEQLYKYSSHININYF